MLDLTPIKARLAAVPAPPWGEFCESGDWWIHQQDAEELPVDSGWICCSGPDDMDQEIADFIVAAPSDVQALITEVEQLRTACEQIVKACEYCDQGYAEYSPPGLDAWLPTGDPNIIIELCPYCGPARQALGLEETDHAA